MTREVFVTQCVDHIVDTCRENQTMTLEAAIVLYGINGSSIEADVRDRAAAVLAGHDGG